jgi:hypothetical protein
VAVGGEAHEVLDAPITESAGPTFERFGRRTVETVVGFSLAAAANSLYLLVVARGLGAAGTGVVSVMMLLASGLAFVVSGVLVLANVYYGAREPSTLGRLLSNSLVVSAGPGVALAGLVFAAFPSSPRAVSSRRS